MSISEHGPPVRHVAPRLSMEEARLIAQAPEGEHTLLHMPDSDEPYRFVPFYRVEGESGGHALVNGVDGQVAWSTLPEHERQGNLRELATLALLVMVASYSIFVLQQFGIVLGGGLVGLRKPISFVVYLPVILAVGTLFVPYYRFVVMPAFQEVVVERLDPTYEPVFQWLANRTSSLSCDRRRVMRSVIETSLFGLVSIAAASLLGCDSQADQVIGKWKWQHPNGELELRPEGRGFLSESHVQWSIADDVLRLQGDRVGVREYRLLTLRPDRLELEEITELRRFDALRVDSAAYCRQSYGCRAYGQCVPAKSRGCVAASADDCRASQQCKKAARCSLVGDQCQRTSAADCGLADACRLDGRCAWNGIRCVRGTVQ